MKKILSMVTALACSVGLLFSTAVTAFADDEDVFPSGVKHKALDKITTQAYDSDFEYPASAYLVFKGDETIMKIIQGDTDIENQIHADEETVFDWGSITKTMVWVSVMQLWEQGLIDLDADVRTYLPDNFFSHLSYDDEITMMNLMNHTGGWCEQTYNACYSIGDEDKIPTLEQALRDTEPAQTYRPGEVTSYSNWGTALAGYIVERITGKDFYEYARENIFEPLGMEHTSIAPDMSDNTWVREKRMNIKTYTASLITLFKPVKSITEYNALYPCGSAVGTIDDLATYARSFVNDDAPLFQKKETLEKMLSGSNFVGGSDIPFCSYGLWIKDYATARLYGHDGFSGWHSSNMVFDPVSKYGYVGLTANRDNYVDISDRIFGELSAEKYTAIDDDEPLLSGYYTTSRSNTKGIFRIVSLFYNTQSIMESTSKEDVEDMHEEKMNVRHIGDNAYVFVDEEHDEVLGNMSMKSYSDGRTGISLNGSDMILDRFYLFKITLLALYFITAATAIFVLMIKLKLKKSHRLTSGAGQVITTIGEIAKIISAVLVMMIIPIALAEDTLITPRGTLTAIGITQLVCMALFAASIIVSVCSLAKKGTKFQKACCIFNIAGNLIVISTCFCFEFYRFWGC